ncbi:hypothetical protein BO86DRAFT_159319 [Aspergillus japonicus CBS 114.51]|uniref:Uncharacterized protein n=1 Tax=Aspergillus japonicus CBS 114.51 TaxID=1448312 RepID=A0A8T8XBR4_ASPJA|nr:hypothetical protein BO86DRAFT_159319 [Aspergillus japonicus CBS 114.51]RAH85511.1 hypothetical protein BO86DRAFT_159319 [Aspergillus japonicus CBS 114.51]
MSGDSRCTDLQLKFLRIRGKNNQERRRDQQKQQNNNKRHDPTTRREEGGRVEKKESKLVNPARRKGDKRK